MNFEVTAITSTTCKLNMPINIYDILYFVDIRVSESTLKTNYKFKN